MIIFTLVGTATVEHTGHTPDYLYNLHVYSSRDSTFNHSPDNRYLYTGLGKFQKVSKVHFGPAVLSIHHLIPASAIL